MTVPTKEEREAICRRATTGLWARTETESDVLRLLAALDEVERERDEALALAVSLDDYAEHGKVCVSTLGPGASTFAHGPPRPCDCGLVELRAAARKGATT